MEELNLIDLDSIYRPVDSEAILEIGLDNWLYKNDWPVSEVEFAEFVDCVLQSYNLLCTRPETTIRDLFYIDHQIIVYLIQIAHANLVKLRSKKVLSLEEKHSRKYFFPKFDRDLSNNIIPLDRNFLKSLHLHFRSIFKTLFFNFYLGPIDLFRGISRKSNVWSVGAESEQKIEFIKKNRSFCRFLYVENILSSNSGNVSIKEPHKKIKSYISSFFRDIEKRYPEFLNGIDTKILKTAWHDRLAKLNLNYQTILQLKDLPQVLYVSNVASPMHKLFSLALLRKGVEVNGFNHGNNMMLVLHKHISLTELSHFTNFICFSKKSAIYFNKIYLESKLSKIRHVNFLYMESSYYKKLLSKSIREQPKKIIKEVVLMGYPSHSFRYLSGVSHYGNLMVDLEIKIAKNLKSLGYTAVYQAHPEAEPSTIKIISDYFDDIRVGNFERNMDEADAFIFTYTSTTTFHYSLCSDKHIILISHSGERWNKDSFPLLKKRCNIVTANNDHNNLVEFDLNEFESSLKHPISFTYDYVNEIMI